jgi:hypothetical protein
VAVLLPASILGTDQNLVLYVLVLPDGRLVARQAAGQCGLIVDEYDPPYQAVLWSAVIRDVDPGRGQVNGIALDAGVRAKVADAADAMPELYPDNPIATAMLFIMGGPAQSRRGTVAIVAEEDPETGLTASLNEAQLSAIAQAHQMVMSQAQVEAYR